MVFDDRSLGIMSILTRRAKRGLHACSTFVEMFEKITCRSNNTRQTHMRTFVKRHAHELDKDCFDICRRLRESNLDASIAWQRSDDIANCYVPNPFANNVINMVNPSLMYVPSLRR